jgi:malate dehydrogenase (oxaloacetate-decarboxylating)(NADP+)
MSTERKTFTDEEALAFHRDPVPGKLSVTPSKPMATQRDLSLAYSPGVAVPVEAIARDPDLAYEYTSKGNLVAVISNGTAILGLGALGPLASKPVMEGKSVLFKRFADIDSIDIEVDSTDTEELITTIRNISGTFGGINLEDIKSPECFIIESRLKELCDIPVFHDDQHGTAIIAAAGIINACLITGRELKDLKVVVSGAGAAGLSCAALIKSMGVRHENVLMIDREGVIYRGRQKGMDQFKSAFAVDTDRRTLAEAMVGADCFLGLSVKGAVDKAMVASMAPNPIIFAMANPDPEIRPEEIAEVRSDAIVATGRSDYPNQVNNVLGFPYIFRGALDVRARTINEEMKAAAALALAELAREDVPDEVMAAYHGRQLKFGRDYVIPTPFDPRLIATVPPIVAKAAMDTGVARRPIEDMDAYRASLAQRLDPTASLMQRLQETVRTSPKTMVFCEGEDPAVIRAAYQYAQQDLGKALVIGREETVRRNMGLVGVPDDGTIEIHNARLSDRNPDYTDFLYRRLQRRGYLVRDCQRMVNNDRNVFGACMVALGDADGLVTGATRTEDQALREVMLAIDPLPRTRPIGMSAMLAKGRTIFVADTTVTEMPDAEDLAQIAIQAAGAVKRLGFVPRVAFVAYSTFGRPMGERSEKCREAVALLDRMDDVDFEYDGEMAADLALSSDMKRNYPFCRLSGPANVLVMPAIHSAHISTHLIEALGGATVLGPMMVGLKKPVQICSLGAPVSEIVTLATLAAYDVNPAFPK